MIWFWFLAGARDFPFLQNVQTESRVHPASFSMGIGGSVPESKVASMGGALQSSAKIVKESRIPPPHPAVCLHGMH